MMTNLNCTYLHDLYVSIANSNFDNTTLLYSTILYSALLYPLNTTLHYNPLAVGHMTDTDLAVGTIKQPNHTVGDGDLGMS